jgi:hypothetical protein
MIASFPLICRTPSNKLGVIRWIQTPDPSGSANRKGKQNHRCKPSRLANRRTGVRSAVTSTLRSLSIQVNLGLSGRKKNFSPRSTRGQNGGCGKTRHCLLTVDNLLIGGQNFRAKTKKRHKRNFSPCVFLVRKIHNLRKAFGCKL